MLISVSDYVCLVLKLNTNEGPLQFYTNRQYHVNATTSTNTFDFKEALAFIQKGN